MNKLLKQYLSEVNKTKRYKNEYGLFKQLENETDKLKIREIKNKIVNNNLLLVIYVANKFKDRKNLLDIIQEGNYGLYHAISKFDYKKGIKFSTYAFYWIRVYCSRCFEKNNRIIRIPFDKIWNINKLKKINKGDELPLIFNKNNTESLDYNEYIKETIEDNRINVEEEALNSINLSKIKAALKKLNKTEKYVINRRYGEDGGLSLRELSKEMGLCYEWVRQIEKKAINKIKNQIRINK